MLSSLLPSLENSAIVIFLITRVIFHRGRIPHNTESLPTPGQKFKLASSLPPSSVSFFYNPFKTSKPLPLAGLDKALLTLYKLDEDIPWPFLRRVCLSFSPSAKGKRIRPPL